MAFDDVDEMYLETDYLQQYAQAHNKNDRMSNFMRLPSTRDSLMRITEQINEASKSPPVRNYKKRTMTTDEEEQRRLRM